MIVVDVDVCRGPRKDYTSKEEERKKKRDEVRTSTLKSWEEQTTLVYDLIALSYVEQTLLSVSGGKEFGKAVCWKHVFTFATARLHS